MTDGKDPLWDPTAPPDADLARIQRALASYGVTARTLSMPVVPTSPRLGRNALPWALAASVAILLLGAGYQYRLAWTSGRNWTAVLHYSPAGERTTQLVTGAALQTASNETATIEVARIGTIALSPSSSLRLVETGKGKHRVALEQGHLRARIWAPPGYFGVQTRAGEVVDLGCDFDLWKRADGSGRVFVRSGWISYRVGSEDILVPQGYGVNFASEHGQTPLRPDAPADLVDAVHDLDALLQSRGARAGDFTDEARHVAHQARDRDAFTLLSLMTRWPALASTEIYPRLAAALGVQLASTAHRNAWEAGDGEAIDAWWQKLPRQPKQWWAHWKDAMS